MANIRLNTRFYRLFPSTDYLGYGYEAYEAEHGRSAFVVIDVYGLGFHPDDPVPAYNQAGHAAAERPALAWLGSSQHEDRIIKTALLPALNAARAIKLPVIYLNNSAPKIGLRHSEFGKVLQRQLNTDMEHMFAEDDVDPKEYHYGDSDHVKISKLLTPVRERVFRPQTRLQRLCGDAARSAAALPGHQEPVYGRLFGRCLPDDDRHRRAVAQLQGGLAARLHPGQ